MKSTFANNNIGYLFIMIYLFFCYESKIYLRNSFISNSQYFNQSSEYQRQYASSTYFGTALNYSITAIQYVKSIEDCFLFQMQYPAAQR